MSNLPKYSRNPEEEDAESAPLINAKANTGSFPDLEAQAAVYPPRPLPPLEGDEERAKVTYTFIPRWPIEGDKQDAIGVMGRNKAEAVYIVQGGFSSLAGLPPQRIEFLAPMKLDSWGHVVDDRWGIVMDEAWPALLKDPPAHLKVQVQDAPGDAEARKRRKHKRNLHIILITVFVACAVLPLTIGFIVWVSGGSRRK